MNDIAKKAEKGWKDRERKVLLFIFLTYKKILTIFNIQLGFSDGSAVKNLPTMQKTRVQSLGWEDHLEEEIETHTSILAWKIPWKEEPGGLQSMGLLDSDTT